MPSSCSRRQLVSSAPGLIGKNKQSLAFAALKSPGASPIISVWFVEYCREAASASFLLQTSWPQMATTYFAKSCSFHSASSAAHGVCEQTIMSAFLPSNSRHSRTYGKGGTSRTISEIALLTACDQTSALFRSGSSLSATAFSSVG